jgi:hypothetical protein
MGKKAEIKMGGGILGGGRGKNFSWLLISYPGELRFSVGFLID